MIQSVVIYICLLLVWCINVYGEYKASAAVRTAHNIPHLNENFQLIDNEEFKPSQEYAISLFIFPALMLGAGLISVLIFLLIWLFRCICTCCCRCCKCLQCLPNDSKAGDMNDEQLQELRQKIVTSRRKVLGFFIGFIFLGILASQATLLGNSYITKGVRKENEALGIAKEFFEDVGEYSGGIHDNAETIDDILQNDPCVTLYSDFINDIYEVLDQLESISDTIRDSVDAISGNIGDAQDKLLEYGIHTKNTILYSCYAGYMFLLFLFLFNIVIRNTMITRLLCLFTVSIVVILTLCVFIETVLVMFLGDICLDPAGNVASLFPKGDARNVIMYYTTCQGSNPLGYQITNTSQYTDQLNTYYDQLNTLACPANSDLQAVKPYIDDLTLDAENLVGLTDCSTIYAAWNAGINQGLCQYLFNGLFTLWIGQYILSGSLFMTMCFGVVLYGYYGHLWHVSVDDEGPYEQDAAHHHGSCCCNTRQHREVAHSDAIIDAGEVQMTSTHSHPPQADAVVVAKVGAEPPMERANKQVVPSAPSSERL